MIGRLLAATVMALSLALPVTTPPAIAAEPLAKDVFGHLRGPTAGAPQIIGFYSRGCASGLVQLPETGPTWQAMRLSRNRNWGTPQLVSLLEGLGNYATRLGWSGIYVGDMSQPRGGPMITGHASHQLGLDADIWMLPGTNMNLSPAAREGISSQSVVAKNGVQPSSLWSPAHAALLKAAASDPRVQRVFVDPVAKLQLCATEKGDRGYLRKIQTINGHDYHFHVRLRCPEGSPACEGQAEVPAGDHCAAAAQMIQDRLHPEQVKPLPPNPDYRHPRSYRLSELPAACTTIGLAR